MKAVTRKAQKKDGGSFAQKQNLESRGSFSLGLCRPEKRSIHLTLSLGETPPYEALIFGVEILYVRRTLDIFG